jgi:hypothetical protein
MSVAADMMGSMRKALVVAAQTQGLRGCEGDADLITDRLESEGFEVLAIRGRSATRDGVLNGYESLIQSCSPGDAAVVFFAGHGGRRWGAGAAEVRFLVPVDMAEGSADDFRGVLTDELTVLQWKLTLRTRNVTTILDCCFSGRMSRGFLPGGMVVRGIDDGESARSADARLAAAASAFRALRQAHPEEEWADANPHAVRLLACSPSQLAYEGYWPEYGGIHGYLTGALATALRSGAGLTWQALGEQVRYQVLARVPAQRPEITGPITRVAFTERLRPAYIAFPVRIRDTDGSAWVDGARLYGLEPGEAFALAPQGHPVDLERGPRARVAGPVGDAAQLLREDGALIGDGWEAHPLQHGRWAAADTCVRLRDLTAGSAALPVPVRLVVAGAGGELPADQPVLHAGDRLWIRLYNDADRRGADGSGGVGLVYANVLDLGVGGRISVLNATEPSGIELLPGEEHAIGAEPGGHEPGLPLTWPPGLPADIPRFETVMAVFSDRPQDLRVLTQPEAADRDLPGGGAAATRYSYQRVTFVLCPGGASCQHGLG